MLHNNDSSSSNMSLAVLSYQLAIRRNNIDLKPDTRWSVLYTLNLKSIHRKQRWILTRIWPIIKAVSSILVYPTKHYIWEVKQENWLLPLLIPFLSRSTVHCGISKDHEEWPYRLPYPGCIKHHSTIFLLITQSLLFWHIVHTLHIQYPILASGFTMPWS